jgi:ABC-type lipoprotein release transport system permease subunit
VRMILLQSMIPTAMGLMAGLGASLTCARVIEGQLYGVRPTDAATLIGIMALLASGTLFASYRPAARAAALDPLTALRDE